MKSSNIEVFVLSCNRLEFLKESLKSLFAQTCAPIKITVMDNASTDGTVAYLEELRANRNDFDFLATQII